MSLLCFFPPIMFLNNSQVMYRLCWRKCPLCPYGHGKKFTVGDGDRLVQVLFYMLLGFDSLQFIVDCPTAPVLPTRRVTRDLVLSCEIRRLRQACSIMKRLECLWYNFYSRKTAWQTMLYAFSDQLFRKLCWHIRRISSCSSLYMVHTLPHFGLKGQ